LRYYLRSCPEQLKQSTKIRIKTARVLVSGPLRYEAKWKLLSRDVRIRQQDESSVPGRRVSCNRRCWLKLRCPEETKIVQVVLT